MKYFAQAILCTYFLAALANLSEKPAESNALRKLTRSDMINNYYSKLQRNQTTVGPNKTRNQETESKRNWLFW